MFFKGAALTACASIPYFTMVKYDTFHRINEKQMYDMSFKEYVEITSSPNHTCAERVIVYTTSTKTAYLFQYKYLCLNLLACVIR